MKDYLRDKIICEAAIIFNQYSYRKTTIADIAMAVGKGKSSIYYYFKSKEEIFAAVLKQEAEALRKELLNTVQGFTDPAEKIKAYVSTRMEVYKKASNLFKGFTSGRADKLPFVDQIIKEYDERELILLTDIIKQGCQKNKFVINKPELTALAIVTALKSLEKPLFSNDYYSIDSTIEQLIEVLLMGIIKRE